MQDSNSGYLSEVNKNDSSKRYAVLGCNLKYDRMITVSKADHSISQ